MTQPKLTLIGYAIGLAIIVWAFCRYLLIVGEYYATAQLWKAGVTIAVAIGIMYVGYTIKVIRDNDKDKEKMRKEIQDTKTLQLKMYGKMEFEDGN